MTDATSTPEGTSGADLLAAHAASKANVNPNTGLPAAKPAAEAAPGTEADLSIGGDEGTNVAPLTAEPTGPVIIEFNPTGDAGLDMALGFFGKLGLGPGDKAFDAAANGDFAMLKAKLGQLGNKATGYEGFVALAEQAYAKGAEANKSKVAKDVAAIHAAVGGADQWKAIQAWASANADPHEKAEVNAALRSGGVAAKAMAQWLAGKYAKADGTTIEPADVVVPGGAGKAPASANGALSAKDYAAEVQAARQKLGYKFDGSKEYAALQARRTMGQRQGL
jgi:hypothetical protein